MIQITITNRLTTLETKIMAGHPTLILVEAINTVIRIDSAFNSMSIIKRTRSKQLEICHLIRFTKTSGTAIGPPKAVSTITTAAIWMVELVTRDMTLQQGTVTVNKRRCNTNKRCQWLMVLISGMDNMDLTIPTAGTNSNSTAKCPVLITLTDHIGRQTMEIMELKADIFTTIERRKYEHNTNL